MRDDACKFGKIAVAASAPQFPQKVKKSKKKRLFLTIWWLGLIVREGLLSLGGYVFRYDFYEFKIILIDF